MSNKKINHVNLSSARIKLKGPKRVYANMLGTWQFVYIPDRDWGEKGKLYICMRHVCDFSDMQTQHPKAEGFTTVKVDKAQFFLHWSHWDNMFWHPWNVIFKVVLKKGQVRKGNIITITLGDTSLGSPGIRAQTFSEAGFRFRVFEDPTGKGKFTEIVDPSLRFPILPNKWNFLKLICPSQYLEGDMGRTILKATDTYGNTTSLPKKEIILSVDRKVCFRRFVQKKKSEIFNIPFVKIKKHFLKDTIRLSVTASDGSFEIKSNPCCKKILKDRMLLWGDLHAHSYLCDGTGTPNQLFKFARRDTGLGFAAVTSHDCGMHNGPEDYKKGVYAANMCYEPGKFTTLLGMEWSGISKNGGDRNIYFRGSEGRFFNSGHIIYQIPTLWPDRTKGKPAPPWAESWMFKRTKYSNIVKVYEEADKGNMMIIPHGGGRICNLAYHEPVLEPSIEIFSCHGNFENLAVESLIRGYRMGFIGSSDDHRGAIGDSYPHRYWFLEHNGLAAVYATENTREGIWEAFQKRCVYATTGERIILAFEMNNIQMGASITYTNPSKKRIFKIKIHGTNFIRRVELWRNGVPVFLNNNEAKSEDVEIEFIDRDPLDKIKWTEKDIFGRKIVFKSKVCGNTIKRATAAYFVKVVQRDGHMAWSSPIWVDLD